MKNKVLVGFLSLLIATLVVSVGPAQSQEAYPTKPIEIIVTNVAGGSADLVGRTVAFALSKKWGVPVNVVNKPGGNTIPGQVGVYKSNPDGYTMYVDANSTSSMLAVSVKDLPFNVMDRTFVSTVGMSPQIFVTAANSPFKSLKEAAAEARRDPGNFVWTVNGAGTDSVSFALRQFFKAIDVDPQKTKAISVAGGAQAVVMIAGGHAMFACTALSNSAPFIKGGTVRGLALTSKNRHSSVPDVPTTAELGYPSVNAVWWSGISGPPKLPTSIAAKWEKALEEILRDPELIAKMDSLGIVVSYLNSQQTREVVIKETDDFSKVWGGLIKSGG